jgi:sulfotransferase family protein
VSRQVEGEKEKAAAGTPPSAPWEELTELEDYQALCRARLKHLVPVREPLVLVSQVQRSGGTLLSQLFDGHPECHAHPHELKIGYPRKRHWPPLDLNRPESWFEMLFESRSLRHLRRGYSKSPKRHQDHYDVFPFAFLPRLQKAIFDACVEGRAVSSERDVLDCYFTSYFNAWLDNHNLYTGPKRVVAGFTPRLAMKASNLERFFAAYPEGTLISIVRDPRAWYVSASNYLPELYADVEIALELWRLSAESAMEAGDRYGERVLVLTYERLLEQPEATMARIAERIGITMSPQLLEPTFNGRPIRANSAYPVERYGILPERAGAHRDSLDPERIERIGELAGDVYERAAALAAL